VFIVCKQRGRR